MVVDEKVKERPGRMKSSTGPSTQIRPVVEIRTTRPKHPSEGMTPAELETNWRRQVGDTAIKHQPLLSDVDCDYCSLNNIICWTIPGHTACVSCRYDKKRSCSNAPPRNKTPKQPKEPKTPKDTQAAKKLKPKKSMPVKESDAVTTVPSGSQHAAGKPKSQRASSQPAPVVASTPASQKKPKINTVHRDNPTPSSAAGKAKATARVDPPAPAGMLPGPQPTSTESTITQEKSTPAFSVTPTSRRGASRSRAVSPAQPSVKSVPLPAAEVFDPLICAPATDSEPRCECHPTIHVPTGST